MECAYLFDEDGTQVSSVICYSRILKIEFLIIYRCTVQYVLLGTKCSCVILLTAQSENIVNIHAWL